MPGDLRPDYWQSLPTDEAISFDILEVLCLYSGCEYAGADHDREQSNMINFAWVAT